MNVDEAIYTILAAELTVSTPLEQISPRPIGSDVAYPHVWFQFVDDPERSDRPERWRRMRVHSKDSSYAACIVLVDAIHGALSHGYGTVGDEFDVDNIQCIDRGSDPQENAETKKFETYSDYRVCYH